MPLDVGELLSTGTVPCISAPQFYVSFWKTGATVIQQCALHGTSLSSDVLIARVRTLALCWTRRHPTIAYKYHGSLLWIVQLGTNIRETCRWIGNLFLADAEAELTNTTWRFGYSYIVLCRAAGKVTHKNQTKKTQWRICDILLCQNLPMETSWILTLLSDFVTVVSELFRCLWKWSTQKAGRLKKLLSKYVDKSLVNSATLGTMLTPEGRAIDGTCIVLELVPCTCTLNLHCTCNVLVLELALI